MVTLVKIDDTMIIYYSLLYFHFDFEKNVLNVLEHCFDMIDTKVCEKYG